MLHFYKYNLLLMVMFCILPRGTLQISYWNASNNTDLMYFLSIIIIIIIDMKSTYIYIYIWENALHLLTHSFPIPLYNLHSKSYVQCITCICNLLRRRYVSYQLLLADIHWNNIGFRLLLLCKWLLWKCPNVLRAHYVTYECSLINVENNVNA